MSNSEYSDYSYEEDKIYILEEQLKMFHLRVNELWDNVIVPYISNPRTRQILTKLEDTAHDRLLFYYFMLKNNSSYNKLLKHLEILKNKEFTTQSEHKE